MVKIDSTTEQILKLTTNNTIVELVYVDDSNKGWLVKLNQAGSTPSSF